MIRELLDLLFVRQLSYKEAEAELEIDRTTMQSRIDMMVHMGYLIRTTISTEGCDGGCMGCSKGTIPECGEKDPEDGRSLSGYELTAKGKRVLEK